MLLFAGGAIGAEANVSFNRDIRPFMADTCWRCHGPSSHEGGVRFDLRDSALAEADSGLVPIVPGDPDASEAICRAFSDDESEVMPPADSLRVLLPAQKEMFRRWVAEGAHYETHWAYQQLRRPPPAGSAENPIDGFVGEKLVSAGLTFAPEADARVLLRRLSFDLTGLPPTLEDADRFAAGGESYEAAVERLLASPRFAERQTQHWMDVVRFADTRGFHSDDQYPIWPYRDYVLQAFDENLPFDEFTREQLAGDLLPEATERQRTASAFNRLNRTSVEGGIQEKEYVAKYGADRVRTVGLTWFAQTIGCAECHDHKYDPLKQSDFYGLKAFFADMKHPSAYGGQLDLPSAAQSERQRQLQRQAEAAQAELDKLADGAKKELTAHQQTALADDKAGRLSWTYLTPVAATSGGGVALTVYDEELLASELMLDGSQYVRHWPGRGVVVASGPNPDRATYEVRLKPGVGEWAQLGLEIFADGQLPANSLARGNDTFYLSGVELRIISAGDETSQPIEMVDAVDDNPTAGPSANSPLAAIDDDDETTWSSPPAVSLTHNALLAIRFAQALKTEADDVLVVRLKQQSSHRQGTIGRFRLALATDVRCWPTPTEFSWLVGAKTPALDAGQAPPVQTSGLPSNLRAALATDTTKRTDEQRQAISAWQSATHPALRGSWRTCEELRVARGRLQAQIPSCLVSEQADQPTTTRVLPRGDWMNDSGKIVEPAIPESLGRLETAGRATRLDLANWIVSDANPLTARVVANRLWQQLFGVGLCRTPDDFGSQGDWPEQAALLDWLACELKDPSWLAAETHRWDYKHLVRVIVLSKTYRQSSLPSADALQRDPENRLLSRQNRHRLDAEAIRDQALAASGLLRERFGGPSVRPYQAPGYLAALNFPRRDYPTSSGADLWRRSLYTFWQRTFPHPTLTVFDAGSREECTASRPISNTPLQSLVLLNDPIFVEAARALAQSTAERSRSTDEQIDRAFQSVLSRPPRIEEHAALAELFAEARREFSSADAATAFLSIGDAPLPMGSDPRELAALTATTRAILNLHEAVTRN